MNKIIYDSAVSGHHTEYISHLVKKIINENIQKKNYFFIVSEAIQEKIPEIIILSKNMENLHWEFIPTAKCENLYSMPLYKRSFYELDLVQYYANKFKATEVVLMYFNIFQIALIFKKPSFEITAILFLQFYRMQRNTISEKLKYYRKYWITKLYCTNSKIKTVFILNDKKTVDYLNLEFKTYIFNMLPDPISIYKEEEGFNVNIYYSIPLNKKILLHPGSIDPRKGTYEIIDSIDFLKDKATAEYAILIVGKAKPNIESIIRTKLESLKNKRFTIIFDNTFVSNERLKSLFMQSYAILMPYKNVEASSGIMGHAAIANKCVLAPDSGLIGEIIKKYKLGILINKPVAVDIAEGITRLEEYSNDKMLSSEFTSQHTVEVFSSSLLN